MTEPRVFDHTAIVALFDGNKAAFELWQRADREELTIVMPAAAVAEAGR